jgi:hypothetical protein
VRDAAVCFGVAATAVLVSSNLASAAPWSFDPQRYLASFTDAQRCGVGSPEPAEASAFNWLWPHVATAQKPSQAAIRVSR